MKQCPGVQSLWERGPKQEWAEGHAWPTHRHLQAGMLSRDVLIWAKSGRSSYPGFDPSLHVGSSGERVVLERQRLEGETVLEAYNQHAAEQDLSQGLVLESHLRKNNVSLSQSLFMK